jgi:hypothetical protein
MDLFFSMRWILCALVPGALFIALYRGAHGRRPGTGPWIVTTFVLGAAGGLFATYLTARASALTSLDSSIADAGVGGELLYAFFVLAPVHEAATVAAVWPALVSRQITDAADGVGFAAAASLGFHVVDAAAVLRAHPVGAVWIARVLIALPANVFLACVWGYALGLAKRARGPSPVFPLAFVGAVAAHGLFAHEVYGRGAGALLAMLPLLGAMAAVAWLVGRDLPAPGPSASVAPSLRLDRFRRPPSLAAVRAAMRRADEPVRMGWIALGALVNLGAMVSGVAAAVLAARGLHVDFSTVDEQDVAAASPALLLGAGLLASFPMSSWLVARAANVRTLLEPALAAVVALGVTLATLSFVAPSSVLFAFLLSPVAWLLACAGAWMGLEA